MRSVTVQKYLFAKRSHIFGHRRCLFQTTTFHFLFRQRKNVWLKSLRLSHQGQIIGQIKDNCFLFTCSLVALRTDYRLVIRQEQAMQGCIGCISSLRKKMMLLVQFAKLGIWCPSQQCIAETRRVAVLGRIRFLMISISVIFIC